MTRTVWLFALVAMACKGDKPGETGITDTADGPEDVDGDGFTEEDGDCAPEDAAIHPGAAEVCDGVDNNCDGVADEGVTTTWYQDTDGDGFGDPGTALEACAAPEGYVSDGTDCDDASATTYPSAAERCDELDNDCDDAVDEAVQTTWYGDADADGYGNPDAALESCDPPEGYVADGADCDDSQGAINPGADELCNTWDDDCDGAIDEDDAVDAGTWYPDADSDGFGDADQPSDACETPSGYVGDATDCDDADAAVNPDADELCNGIDDDCDGTADEPDAVDAGTWYADADADSFGDAATSTVQCDQPSGYVADSADCDDGDAGVNPDGTEVCNGIDDDCDGTTDEPDATDASAWYADADADSFGDATTSTIACDQPSGYVSDDTDCDDTDASVYPGAAESWFDGTDSDCDGDEEPDICVDVPTGAVIADDPSCTYTPSSTWSVVTEWETDTWTYSAGNSYTRIMMAPAVGQLTDDNGDGFIDELDHPDIVYTTFTGSSYRSAGYLRVMSADADGTITEHLSVSSVTDSTNTTRSIGGTAGVAIADIDNDGTPEILTHTTSNHLVAMHADGTVLWFSEDTSSDLYAYPSVADMDGDGLAEIATGNVLVDSGGSTIVSLSSTYTGRHISHLADIDDDGTMEWVTGNGVFEMDGTTVWTASQGTGHSAVLNLDSDDYGEVVMHNGGNLYAYDHDGTLLWTGALGSNGYGAPCVADFDGDGSVDIGIGGQSYFAVFDASGNRIWRNATRDSSSRSASCTAFDFDGDGAYEVLYADEYDLWIFDGVTGATLYRETNHASGTVYEHPFVADVDNDGNAEIVLPTNNYARSGWDGLYVLGEANDQWPSARPVWNQHAFSRSHINDDLSVPAGPYHAWLDHNTFRAQASAGVDPLSAPNLSVGLIDVCEDCSAGSLEVYVSLDNDGAVFVPEGVSIALYADDASVRTLIDVTTTTARCEPGQRLAPVVFTISPGDVGADGLVAVVDDDGTGAGVHSECDETDNAGTWDALTCSSS
ncbi:MAG: hypothetical protein H6739_01240 [Alphaproteobacteria bacterium]|nr:hypothetical protein [Alphaproteobacteria bacterium]